MYLAIISGGAQSNSFSTGSTGCCLTAATAAAPPLSPPETTTHHYAAQKTDSSPAISVWNNVAIAHAKERYGYQPETVQDVDVLVVVVPELVRYNIGYLEMMAGEEMY